MSFFMVFSVDGRVNQTRRDRSAWTRQRRQATGLTLTYRPAERHHGANRAARNTSEQKQDNSYTVTRRTLTCD